jgi:hypothetical protein
MQDDDNPNSKRMGVDLDREGFLGSEGGHHATTPDRHPPILLWRLRIFARSTPVSVEIGGILQKKMKSAISKVNLHDRLGFEYHKNRRVICSRSIWTYEWA